jgi:uncharacterized protein (TIGR03086 family)
MDLATLYQRTVDTWVDRVTAVAPDQWDRPTPCQEWNVRDLVNHVTGEDLWTSPLVHGASLEDVGTKFDGDVVGGDPIGSAREAAHDASAAVAETLPAGGTVHLSYGEERIEEYVHQLAADHLVHAWDLAVATGGDARLDPEVVDAVTDWLGDRADLYRSAGLFAPAVSTGGDAQARLIGAAGRDPQWAPHH